VLKPTPDRFDTIHNEVTHLQRLVQDLRILSLADADELVLQRQPVPPGDLLERVSAAYQHALSQKGVDLQVQVQPGLPTVNVDPERVVQILGNLVSNALRYTPKGGRVVLSAYLQERFLCFSVQDNGVGIDPEALPHIFDRFYRADDARQGGESGLGLAIAKSLVEAHGGKIEVKSELGWGTKFVVLFVQG
jgi:signal transduction histidine kinase